MRLPDVDDRLVIIGRTGGGKTQCGLWHLSLQPIASMPWIIIDWKGDKSIAEIPYAQVITLRDAVPTLPGVYVVRPLSGQESQVDDYLREIWNTENVGLYVDEGMMLRNSRAFSDIQVQGRSKNIPVITLTQLPVYLPRTVFTEASFIQCFFVIDERYRKIISQFSSITSEDIDRLQRYWSWYYDVVNNTKQMMKPVPDIKLIMERFKNTLAPLYANTNTFSEIEKDETAGERYGL